MSAFAYIDENLARIRKAAEEAAASSPYGQDYDILLATKYATAEEINYAHSLGIRKIGENRVQSLLEKYDKLDKDDLEIHFIGTLQKNKVKYVIDKVSMIESLDSLSLAEEIEKQAAKRDIVMDCLIEVNIGDEEAKGGIAKGDVLAFADALDRFPHIRVVGLMTMAPKCTEIEDFRRYFRKSYEIFLDFFAKKSHNIGEPVLSMGMSDSYECAIEEGATIVRVGSSIFGSRVYH